MPGTDTTMVPAVALAREADAPVMVVAAPSVPSAEYCRVEAVAPFAVAQMQPMEIIWIGPPETVQMVVPLTKVAAGLTIDLSCAAHMNGSIFISFRLQRYPLDKRLTTTK